MSLVGSREPDMAVEDEDFARAMEQTYEEDLTRVTEIVLLSLLSAELSSEPG